MSRGILSIRQAEMRERVKARARDWRLAMSVKQIKSAQRLRRQGWSYPAIASRFQVHRDTVRRYVNRAD